MALTASRETAKTVSQADRLMTNILHNTEIRERCTQDQMRVFREAERELYALRSVLDPGGTLD